MGLLDAKHLNAIREIRRSVIRVLCLCAALFILAASFVEPIMRELTGIIGTKLILSSLPEAFMAYLKVALIIALLGAVPYMIIEIVRLIGTFRPMGGGFLWGCVISGIVLFYGGAVFCYFVTLPSGIKFLLQYQTENIKPMISLSAYISFVSTFMFAFGAMFELPLAMFILGRLGIVDAAFLNRKRRFFILGNAIVSAVLTPTPDVFNMLLMMAPLQILFEIGVVVVWFSGRPRLQKADESV